MKKILTMFSSFAIAFMLVGCSNYNSTNVGNSEQIQQVENNDSVNNSTITNISSTSKTSTMNVVEINPGSGPIYSLSDLFTSRDLKQEVDLSEAVYFTVSDEEDIKITEGGIYVIQGTAKNATVYVEAKSDEKVQIVLDGVSITNSDFPCIYVKTADKVFITTTDSENLLEVVDSFVDDGDVNTNGVIFSKEDITLNGMGTLTINSTKNGIVGKDDLKITGGTYYITASKKTIDANDSIRILDGTFVLNAGTDGLHAENNDDDTIGYIYIAGGDFTINAGDDAIHATSIIQIDDGNFVINGSEGIEATYIQINGGTIDITASDDGINASRKSRSYEVAIEIVDGNIKIVMGAGDTDGIDSNGNLYIYGGTIDISARSPTDYDGIVVFNGGKLIIDGVEYDYVPNQMMGGGRGGNRNNSDWQGMGNQQPMEMGNGGRNRRGGMN